MRVETVGVLRFLHGGCSRKGLDQKPCPNVIFSIRASGSFGLFVGQCVASLEASVMSSSGTPLSQSDVTRSSLVLLCVQSSQCESAKCNSASASCCSCLFNQVL